MGWRDVGLNPSLSVSSGRQHFPSAAPSELRKRRRLKIPSKKNKRSPTTEEERADDAELQEEEKCFLWLGPDELSCHPAVPPVSTLHAK